VSALVKASLVPLAATLDSWRDVLFSLLRRKGGTSYSYNRLNGDKDLQNMLSLVLLPSDALVCQKLWGC
jgi:hypothetical protein